jgi:outer membrane receptor protein involved in Fe transport
MGSSRLMALLASASCACVAASAGAQTQPSDAPPGPDAKPAAAVVEEIIVTARKRPEKLGDVPMGVTALAGKTLDENQRVQFSDFAALVPGLSLQVTSRAETQLTLRGENANSAGSTVAVYVDDSPFGSSNALANGSIVTGNFETFDLQRVEVLRGPQGTLYGANTEGGLVKFVTKPPDLYGYYGAIEIGGQAVDGGSDALLLKGMANFPLVTDKLALRIMAFDDGIPGFINDPLLGLHAVDRGRTWGVRPSLLVQPTEALTLRLTAFMQQLNLGGLPSEDAVGAQNTAMPPPDPLQPIRDLTQNRYLREGYIERTENFSATLGYDFGWANATAITSWGLIRQDRLLDATSTLTSPGYTYGEYISSLLGANVGLAQAQFIPLHKFTEELRLASETGNLLEWQVGAFYTRETAAIVQNDYAINLDGGGNAGFPPVEVAKLPSVYREVAIFAEGSYHITPQFNIALGGRLATNAQHAAETLSGTLVGPTLVFPAKSHEGVATYSIAPRYRVNDTTLVYGRVATGFRPGGPNILPPHPEGVPSQYGPDRTFNYEVGLRSNVFADRLSIDVDAFHINWKDIQLDEIVDNYSINGNGGTAISEGIEWSFVIKPVTGLTTTLSGAYIDAHLTSAAPAVGGRVGDPLPYVPSWSTSIDGDYNFFNVDGYSASVGATWSLIGPRYSDFEGNFATKLPTTTQLDLRTSLRNGNWFGQIYVKNITNARGIEAYASSGNPFFTGGVTVTQSLTVGFVVSREF